MIPKKLTLINGRGDILPLNDNGSTGLFVLEWSGLGVNINFDLDKYQASQIVKNRTLDMQNFVVNIKIGLNYSATTPRQIYAGLIQFLNHTPYTLQSEDDAGTYLRDVQLQTMTLTDLKEGQIFEETLEFICTSLWYSEDIYEYTPQDLSIPADTGKVFDKNESTTVKNQGGYGYLLPTDVNIAPYEPVGNGAITPDMYELGSPTITGAFLDIDELNVTFQAKVYLNGTLLFTGGTFDNDSGLFTINVPVTPVIGFNDIVRLDLVTQISPDTVLDTNNVPLAQYRYGYIYGITPNDVKGIFNVNNDSVYMGLTDGSPCIITAYDPVSGITNPAVSVTVDGNITQSDRYVISIPNDYAWEVSSIDGTAYCVRYNRTTGVFENIYQYQDQTKTNFIKIPVGDSQVRFGGINFDNPGSYAKIIVRRERLSIG
ncbi:gp15 [Listeria phage P40]|uniref:minor tail protein n=1 Tax=Listeria phage P40 TaxID=560178 RepID=UPI00018198D5|nr:minor tail protein [Listeria phage P40]ACI00375.1 gp15 [Listeria phage P40]